MILAEDKKSNVVTIPVAAEGGICDNDFGLPNEAVATLDAGGLIRGAVLSLHVSGNGRQVEAWTADYDATRLSLLANADLLPLADPEGVCKRHAYSTRRFQPPPLLETEVYGWNPAPSAFSNCAGVTVQSGVSQGLDCQDPISWSLSAPVTLPVPRELSAIVTRRIGKPTSVGWTLSLYKTDEKAIVKIGSHFSLSGNIFGGLDYVNELTCEVLAGGGGIVIPSDQQTWAYALMQPKDLQVAFTEVSRELIPVRSSGFDFILIRTRNASVITLPN